jgi:hypothetical protein
MQDAILRAADVAGMTPTAARGAGSRAVAS